MEFHSFLGSISKYPLPVLDASIALNKYIHLDLSSNNSILQDIDVSSSTALVNYINAHIDQCNGKVAYGGYNEIRDIYRRSHHFNQDDLETDRNIHIGMDLWIEAGTPILTPLEGIVHSFAYNKNFGDYGPTIILKHLINDVEFYTLYGHLSLSSIEHLRDGQIFRQGEKLATLGDSSVNGDYPAHLHFQIIKDIGDWVGDYPGVCNKKDLRYYLQNCPDPNLLLKLR